MSDAAARLNAALEGRYTIERELWRLNREAPLYGMLTTGGGLLFAGPCTHEARRGGPRRRGARWRVPSGPY